MGFLLSSSAFSLSSFNLTFFFLFSPITFVISFCPYVLQIGFCVSFWSHVLQIAFCVCLLLQIVIVRHGPFDVSNVKSNKYFEQLLPSIYQTLQFASEVLLQQILFSQFGKIRSIHSFSIYFQVWNSNKNELYIFWSWHIFSKLNHFLNRYTLYHVKSTI
jgi:hypothetical protein